MENSFDIAVIGGGPAGYVGAIKAAQLGAKVVLFEKDTVGGTCLNRGCIPTKSLLKTAHTIKEIREAYTRGILLETKNLVVDMQGVMECKNKAVKQLTGGVAGLLKAWGVKVVKGKAQMKDKTTIVCDSLEYSAKAVLLCGGSVPVVPPIPGAELAGVITSDEMLDLTDCPKKLCIIGGGVIGCEMAAAFHEFGSEVTIVELAPQLLPAMDEEVSDGIKKTFEKRGIKILLEDKVSEIVKSGKRLTLKTANAEMTFDTILLATGRKADLGCLGVLADNIETSRGYVVVGKTMETSIGNIYAPGDINGISMLAHSAFKMAETAVEHILGANVEFSDKVVPSCVYTFPEAASVGITQKAAEEKLGAENIRVGRFNMNANGRALASGEPEGFVKVVVEGRYGEILGVHILGASATENIAEAVALIGTEITVEEAAEIIHAHPTYSEAFMEACADSLKKSVHLPPK